MGHGGAGLVPMEKSDTQTLSSLCGHRAGAPYVTNQVRAVRIGPKFVILTLQLIESCTTFKVPSSNESIILITNIGGTMEFPYIM